MLETELFILYAIAMSTAFAWKDGLGWTALSICAWFLLSFFPKVRYMTIDMLSWGWEKDNNEVSRAFQAVGLAKEGFLVDIGAQASAVIGRMYTAAAAAWSAADGAAAWGAAAAPAAQADGEAQPLTVAAQPL